MMVRDGRLWRAVSLSVSNARLLPGCINRYNPVSTMENGEPTDPTISYAIWDQTAGSNGGVSTIATVGDATAFSVETEAASIVVSDVNDAPVIASSSILLE